MAAEFRVLGPLEIRRDGAPVPLRASRQRTFLAVLLVNRGRVVSVDRLIEDVKAEAERLRTAGVEVGVVLELHGQMRLLDVFDPDGNRVQLAQPIGD